MRPSLTRRGTAWIEQFETDDRPKAAALLDSVRFASADEVLGGVKTQLESVLRGGAQLPVAVFPVLAKEDMQPLRSGGVLPDRPVAFVDYDPSQALSPAPGSEAQMASLVRDVARANIGDGVIRQNAKDPITLDRLRDRRVRSLVFVTDYIGSGKQVVDYLATWHRNPTIRSWMSFGWVKLFVVAFASSPQGLALVERPMRPPAVRVQEIAPSLASLSGEQERDVERLCINYAKRAKLRKPPLGHAGSGGLFASAISVPNNLPAILIESNGRWKALFENRSVASNLAAEIGTHAPARDLAHELRLAREERLAERFVEGELKPRWVSRLAVLALLPLAKAEIAQKTGYTLSKVDGILDSLREFGLVDVDGHPTPQGRNEIAHARRRRRRITAQLQGSSDPYYPRLTR